ncbi:NAD-dependent epimerase/dehydratase family protein [Candidatus Ruminimicrobiellum ovillum]|uniref:NAD-dependent epimerase/dehydratase family protein n=1 Tax=Candidatus Ruminimicrobiellum ovillum TaxID=1947927 RepID=UPI00355AC22B
MKTILLTGSGGFIGKNLKEYLKYKYNLLTPRSFELNLTNSNEVKKYFEENKIDFIIHCASVGGVRDVQDKNTTIEDNLAMIDNILKYKSDDTRVILFGSGAMYDKSRNLHKVKEEEIGKVIPEDLYGRSKMLIAEKIKERRDFLMLNIFACYGYGEKETRFPTYAIKSVIDGKNIEINQNVVFDYLWVEDMEKIVYYFIENDAKNNIINITPSQSISLLEIAEIVNAFENNKVNITVKNKTMNNEYTGDNSVLLSEIQNLKFTDIKQGLKKLYNYYKQIK